MADISTEISNFQNAVYGEEVRGSMISLAEKLNDVTEDCEDTVDSMTAGFNAAVEAANTAASAASEAASDANSAATSATNAASSANSAASAATSAANNATSKANAADALNTSVQQAEAARVSAESARASAEAARVTAETARAGSETNRQSAESTRSENETARNSAEISRVSAEAQRNANETSRQSAESSRVSAESSRATAFTQMQNAFDDMSQQVLPPATTSTLGGVIVGTGLSVANDGTLSFEAGDYETTAHAAATYATITTVNGKADAQHVHSASDVTSGTLGVARGGTGVTTAAAERERLGLGSTTGALPIANGGTGATTVSGALSAILDSSPLSVENGGTGAATLTSNAVLTGAGTSAVSPVATASGALYATEANGAASFGTLPIAQGGTGATTADDACTALGAISTDGGVIDGGELYVKNHDNVVKTTTLDRDGTAPASDTYSKTFRHVDKDNEVLAFFDTFIASSGVVGARIVAFNEDSGGSSLNNSLQVKIARDGTRSYTVGDQAAFRSAIGIKSVACTRSLGTSGTAYAFRIGPLLIVAGGYNGCSVSSTYTWTDLCTFNLSTLGISSVTSLGSYVDFSGGGPSYQGETVNSGGDLSGNKARVQVSAAVSSRVCRFILIGAVS